MKARLIITLLLCLSSVQCSKDKIVDSTVYIKTPSDLIGSWNWHSTHGGYAMVTYDPASTGKSIKIELDSLNNYRYFSNDSLKYESKFRIARMTSIFHQSDSALAIIIDSNPMYYKNFTKNWNDFIFNCYFSFQSSDTLVFTDPAYDGFYHSYNRIE